MATGRIPGFVDHTIQVSEVRALPLPQFLLLHIKVRMIITNAVWLKSKIIYMKTNNSATLSDNEMIKMLIKLSRFAQLLPLITAVTISENLSGSASTADAESCD